MGDSGTGTSYLNIYLGQLNITTTSDLGTLHNGGNCVEPFTGDATVNITTVSASTMRNLFTFGTDSIDINDIVSEDIVYRVNWTDNSNNPLDIDVDLSANVISGNIASGLANQNMTYDYVRYIALQLFNTVNGVDLFNNESTLRSSLKKKFNITLNNMLIELASLGSQSANDTTNNPVLSAMTQMIRRAPGRFENIQSDLFYGPGANLSGDEIFVYKIPFLPGDKVYFSVIVDAAEDQHSVVNRVITIPKRTYLLKLTLQ
jgi:hypothetical protein